MARAAVITGGSTEIGKATAALLLERGWRVLVYGRDEVRAAVAQAVEGAVVQIASMVDGGQLRKTISLSLLA